MKGASIGIFIILVVIGVVISGCTEKQADTTEKTIQQNQYGAEKVTATGTPSEVQGAKIPAWLGISKDWRDRVVGKLNLPSEGAGLKQTAGGDDKYDDQELVVGDGVPEMMAGVQGDNIVLVVDDDFWNKYEGWAEQRLSNVNDGNSIGLLKEEFVEVSPGMGLYYLKVPIDGNDRMVFLGKQANNIEEQKDIPRILFKKV
ncbi:MAG: hypothetical protein Q8O41_00540 [Candidatus Methanoperedens sp.]|nr:hypothetical protein [Candidatus Methanoperedens sp.]